MRRQSSSGGYSSYSSMRPSRMMYEESDSTSLLGSLSGQDIDEEEQIRLVDSPDLDPKMNSYPALNNEVPYSPRVHIDRPVINQMVLFPKYNPHTGFIAPQVDDNSDCCTPCLRRFKISPLRLLLRLVPILEWLPKYEWKKDLSFDLVAGFTIAVMHIPQGMAYALLGNLPPIVGIYMAFFPVLVYSFLGTSRQVSMGTFAVICLMTGKTALDRMVYELHNNITSPAVPYVSSGDPRLDIDHLLKDDAIKTRMMEIGAAISLVVGLWQVVMGILRLGSLSLLLSSELVSGFTTGAAIHVFTSQMKGLLGMNLQRRSGIFKIILTFVDIGQNIAHTNIAAFILSSVTVGFLVSYNELVKPYVSSKMSFPIPVELLTVMAGTLVSYYWDLEGKYEVSIVSTIPTGFPVPQLAPMNVFTAVAVLLDGLIIGIVAYAISISMCKIFATKHNYTVDPNQELLAEGTSNVVGSFFSCAPIAASLSRSVIQDSVGGKTQLTSIFSCGILVFVLLWIGPCFESLPNCILSGIIVVALKGMFLQFYDLPKAWKTSKINGLVWIATFLATVILDIEFGLAAGILLSVFLLVWCSTHGSLSTLGVYANCELYVDLNTNSMAREIPGVKILKYTGSLNFVNGEKFISEVERSLILPEEEPEEIIHDKMLINSISDPSRNNEKTEYGIRAQYSSPVPIYSIVFDFSSLSSIDPAALRLLRDLHDHFFKEDIQVLFTGCPPTVLHVMDTTCFLKEIGISRFFPSVQDAVAHLLSLNHNLKQQEHSNINFPIDSS